MVDTSRPNIDLQLTLDQIMEFIGGLEIQEHTGEILGTEITADRKYKLSDLVGEQLQDRTKVTQFIIEVDGKNYKISNTRITLQQAYALRDFIFKPESQRKIYFTREA